MLVVETAGEQLGISAAPRWVRRLAAEGLAGEGQLADGAAATVVTQVESSRTRFPVKGWEPLTRGAWHREGQVVLENACGSGFDLHLAVADGRPVFTARWRPAPSVRLAGIALRSRFHLLSRAVLVQYPVLWWAGVMGRAPLHVGGVALDGTTAVLAGPAGVGKSTLMESAVSDGAVAVADNLCVSDGERLWGLVEPLRSEHGQGRRMPHGRREACWPQRIPALRPEQLLVLRRGGGDSYEITPLNPDRAVRDLICSTYAAGELRRYWSFAALLAAGTGLGPAHPPVAETAERLVSRIPCRSLALPRLSAARPAGLRLCLENAP